MKEFISNSVNLNFVLAVEGGEIRQFAHFDNDEVIKPKVAHLF